MVMDPRADVSDETLLRRFTEGDAEAFEALVRRFRRPLFNFILRSVRDPDRSEELLQEVFLKVFRSISSFRGNSSLKTWIYRIAVNEAYNQRRWFSRHKRREIGLEIEDEGVQPLQEVLSDPGRSPFDLAAGRETRALVEAALTEVNPTFRAAVVLRDMEDLNYEEIADVLQISIGTVKSRILRGREAVRKSLAGRLEPGPDLSWRAQPGGIV